MTGASLFSCFKRLSTSLNSKSDKLIEAERDIPEENNQCGATTSRNLPNENDEISGVRADQNSLKKEKGPPSSSKRSSLLSFMFCLFELHKSNRYLCSDVYNSISPKGSHKQEPLAV